jgi:hypothetical protein
MRAEGKALATVIRRSNVPIFSKAPFYYHFLHLCSKITNILCAYFYFRIRTTLSLSRYNMLGYSANSGRALSNYGDQHVITSSNPPLLFLIKCRVSQASNLWSLGLKAIRGPTRTLLRRASHTNSSYTNKEQKSSHLKVTYLFHGAESFLRS